MGHAIANVSCYVVVSMCLVYNAIWIQHTILASLTLLQPME